MVLKLGFSPYSVITFVLVINFAGVLDQIETFSSFKIEKFKQFAPRLGIQLSE